MPTIGRATVASLVVAAVAAGGCNDSTPVSPNTRPPQLELITIEGPAEVAPGASATYRAIGLYADGEKRDITAAAAWGGGSTPGGVVFTMQGATVTAVNIGEATVNATLPPRNASRTIRVVEPGTFKLSGLVADGAVRLSGATVRLLAGRGPAAPVTVNNNGNYTLMGVAGEIDIDVSATGYQTQSRHLTISGDTVSNFSLEPSAGRPDLTGTYDMTLTVASSCGWGASSGGIRRYTAVISQSGSAFTAALSGGNFVIRSGFGAGFTGTVTPNAVRFFFNTDEGQAWPDIFETIGPNAHFSPEAVGTLVKSGANWSATWSGLAYIYDTTGPYPRTATHQCFSTQHGLLLTPVAGQMRK